MTTQRPADATRTEQDPAASTAPNDLSGTPRGANSATPLYRRLARKEARVREDQYVALSRLVRVLARRRTDRSGPRLTENTLIRVAIDLLLTRANRLTGNTEGELRASVLEPPRSVAADQQPEDQ